MSNITIEKVDAVFERIPSASYAEAKEALIQCDGDVVEAVVFLESKKNTSKTKQAKQTVEDVFGKDGEKVKDQLKELIRKSSVIRVIVEKNDKVIINIPLTVGVVGLALTPIVTLVGLSAAVLSKYRIKVQNEDDGSVVDLGELNEEKLNTLKSMLTNAAKDVKDSVVDKKSDDKDITDELMKEFDKMDSEDKKDENK
ncbi:DUF4342 domain-containing protein [Asaccharospora irregularis]|uniref:DUF4342 domain-containing protein n=1 Tax=Asaccharospora irregularis DSM 2635 TaxID=1121321 RepID=A0A1M5M8M3_9FIRM|nr:DUF4342 domain-containing protein [Asaccharospora irregularis]SHG73163.1 protein of unknown function [Asaccharospora irregularis DSM 2635]